MKYFLIVAENAPIALNHNIKCIEIVELTRETSNQIGLNHNIKCIEILEYGEILAKNLELNHNIKCIEIYLSYLPVGNAPCAEP